MSCNAVKVSFQIKKVLFDLPNIVFSPFRGWKWLASSLISLPSLSALIRTHIQYKHMVVVYYGWRYGVVRVQREGTLAQKYK